MTEQEARGFLSLNEDDDLYDVYEEQLFEHRKFFLSKAPVSTLFEGRIARMTKLQEAFEVLGGTVDHQENPMQEAIVPATSILETYLAFQKSKNSLKMQLSNAQSVPELAHAARALVKLEHDNAGAWHAEFPEEETVIVSREPDPMYLLESIKQYAEQGGKTFAQLKNQENNPPALLVQEMKRLSLLFKKY